MLEALAFYLFGTIMAGSAIAILCTRNIVRAAIWLLGTLGAAAGLYFALSATFLAVVQLILYVGGVLILIVFGVMLTSRDPRLQPIVPRREIAAAIGVAAILLIGMLMVFLGTPWPVLPDATPTAEMVEVKQIGRALLTTYLLPFELISVLLLAVLIGAAYLARPAASDRTTNGAR